MQIAGIVAEYNPCHTGHAYQISRTREALGGDAAVIAVMSGNWVQQGGCAIADKWTRTRLALMSGADLVLELPTLWAASTAESFARGAVEILNGTGVADCLSFGSECGQVDKLRQVARCLDSDAYRSGLGEQLGQGKTFAACRQAVVEELLGPELSGLLATPNNNLGVEYIRSLHALGSTIRPMTVRREGAAHNSIAAGQERPRFVSATQIRLHLKNQDWPQAEPYLVPGGRAVLEGGSLCLDGLEGVSSAVLAVLRKMTAADWENLPDSGAGEGLPRRLEQAGHQCTSLEEFFTLAKTKRYTRARLNRLVLWAYLGLTAEDIPAAPPYLRVLGFSGRGREVLRQMKQRAALPILTKPAHARELDGEGRRLFALEARCTDLYDLCLNPIPAPGREWKNGPVIWE